MPVTKVERRVVFDQPVSPYSNGKSFTAWRRITYPGSLQARWFPEDDEGEVFPFEAFKVVTEVGGDHKLESSFSKMKNRDG